ncbi:MAG TPA: EAL domain-containing protein [Candidatus Accumulibacter phosphatis]|nr:MAG: Cyclic di-GMP phosphodiesterase Gmr [Candidatus Accumulibacter sp. SK-11]HAY29300.1 GGDEF domain-containing protein [Accumulibacter sp.]HCN69905.1 GGDEF domain-containing response regulator [Accumulibacter sp.]HRL74304.1 EAL domain-containing protein [Candidatus Accumulibacter phosphatis]HRQ93647.1 EAL domain-containing protein [Candidatus Accumulibacter phosphatis]
MRATPNVDFSPQVPEIGESSSRILIVDDEDRIRAAYRHLLAAEGRTIEDCGTAVEAQRRLERRDVDVLILDLNLPDISGLEIMQWMVQQHVPTAVVVFSGDESIDSAIRALRHGACEFIRKLGDPQELIDTVDRVLRRRRIEREHALMTVRLEHSERLHRFLVDHSPDFIYTLDRNGCFIFVNGRVEALLGYSREELLGQHYSLIVHPDDLEHARFAFNERRIGDRASTNVEIRLQSRTQGVRHFENRTIVAILSSQGLYAASDGPANLHFMGTSGVARDITERKKAEETIAFQAFHDILTGLPNRSLFKDRLGVALKQARRRNRRVGVMFLDIDRFKLVNDTYGHQEGDELLKSFAQRAASCLRSGDTLARQGGDEFTVMLPELGCGEDAVVIAAKMLSELRRPFKIAGIDFLATVSIGIALYPDNGETPEILLRNADIAMYQIKGQGKNGYLQYNPSMHDGHSRRLTLECDLRAALEQGDQFELHYQPRIRFSERRTIAVEALIRWHHPRLGLMTPDSFVPLAEESGMITALGEWVRGEALRQLAEWRQRGLNSLRLAINLSPKEFEDHDLPQRLSRELAAQAIVPDLVDLDISETLLLHDAERHIDLVKQLRNLGCGVSIDDFGTRYSSLNHLRRLPVDSIKIDQSFVRDLSPQNHNTTTIIHALTCVARSFGLRIVADGVETEAQRRLLSELGGDDMQGHLFSRPLHAAEFDGFLHEGDFPLADALRRQ